MNTSGSIHWQSDSPTGLRIEARFAGRSSILDSGAGAAAPSPVDMLLASIAACGAMDVISILRKKRLDVTAYSIDVSAERADTHPRRVLALALVHHVTGRGVPEAAVAEAIRLSQDKYCSVRASIDPAIPITNRIEIREG